MIQAQAFTAISTLDLSCAFSIQAFLPSSLVPHDVSGEDGGGGDM